MKGKSRIQVVLWAVLFVVAMSFSAYAADGQIKIGQTASTTFPIVIDQPGSYVLTSNILVTAIDVNGVEINTDDVTVDLNGHAIIGPGSGSGSGIYAIDRKNIAVMNGLVRNFFGGGIYFRLCDGVRLKSIIAYNSGTGIYVHGTTHSASIIQSCISHGNSRGMRAHMSTINNCTIYGNRFEGITGEYSTINTCTVCSNGAYGIRSDASIVTNCTVGGNGGDGIFCGWPSYIMGNNIRGNGTSGEGYGINLCNTKNYVIKNAASSNKDGNFYMRLPDENYMPLAGDNANIGW